MSIPTATTEQARQWAEIQRALPKWFSAETKRFFGSKVYYHTLIQRGYEWFFISSEHNYDRTQRLWTIRRVWTLPDGSLSIGEIGGFQQFHSTESALVALADYFANTSPLLPPAVMAGVSND